MSCVLFFLRGIWTIESKDLERVDDREMGYCWLYSDLTMC